MFRFYLRATTIVARNSLSLLNAVKTRLASQPSQSHIAFCLSLNAEEQALATIPRLWKSSIGCLSAPLPEAPDQIVCSVLEVPYGMGRPFVSNIPGRPPTQVGRYHAMHKSAAAEYYDPSTSWYNRAMGHSSTPRRTENIPVPEGLTPIIQNMQTLIYFSDLSPEGVVDSLDYYYTHSMKSGLIAASTPFVTGQPVTLFSNGNILSSGAVGIGIFPQFEEVVHGYEGLESISDTLQVTSSQGNLVHSLDGSNPSKLLASFIKARSSEATLNPKDEDFYLGLLSEDGQRFAKVYTVVSGDPSRGSLALEGEESPTKGSKIKLLRQLDSRLPDALHTLSRRKKAITFVTSSKDVLPPVDEIVGGNETSVGVTVLEDTFQAASENGLLLNQPGVPTWKSTVEGGWTSMSWLIRPPQN